MFTFLLNVVRWCLVPAFVWMGFIAYGLAHTYLEIALPASEMEMLVFLARLAQGFLAAVVTAFLFCYPVAYVYRRFAIGVAGLMTVPVFFIYLPDLFDSTRGFYLTLGSGYQLGAYAVLLICGVWLARSQLEKRGWIKWNS